MRHPPAELPDPPEPRGEDGLTDAQRAAQPSWRRLDWGLVTLTLYVLALLIGAPVYILTHSIGNSP